MMHSDIMKVQFFISFFHTSCLLKSEFCKIKSTSHCVSDIRSDGAALLHDACGALCPKGNAAGVFNSLPWERHEVIQTQDGAGKPTLGMSHI